MSTEFITLIIAVIIIGIVFKALVSVLKTTINTVLVLFAIMIVLSFFGITPDDVVREIANLSETLMRLFMDAQTQTGT